MDAIRQANDGSVPADMLEKAFAAIWTHAFDWVARQYRFTPRMFDAGWREFARVAVTTRMNGYADMRLLAAVPGEKFLVTSGFRLLQESKIRALGIASRFRDVRIDAIDDPDRTGEKEIFHDIVTRYGYRKDRVFVVGDNPESEIAAGKELGLQTVQMLRPGVEHTGRADFHVSGLQELIELLQ